jgi:bifunctional DNA-binding transcriptional regulator/antitoxin component of YhaV-PrlF toxin-antitoxin module
LNKEREMKFTVYIGKDGRITVSKGVRDALGIVEKDLVECSIRKVKRGT